MQLKIEMKAALTILTFLIFGLFGSFAKADVLECSIATDLAQGGKEIRIATISTESYTRRPHPEATKSMYCGMGHMGQSQIEICKTGRDRYQLSTWSEGEMKIDGLPFGLTNGSVQVIYKKTESIKCQLASQSA